jgi:hypothetical protein
MIVHVSRRKIFLRLCRSRRQTRQLSVIQLADRIRHLLRIDLRRLHRALKSAQVTQEISARRKQIHITYQAEIIC